MTCCHSFLAARAGGVIRVLPLPPLRPADGSADSWCDHDTAARYARPDGLGSVPPRPRTSLQQGLGSSDGRWRAFVSSFPSPYPLFQENKAKARARTTPFQGAGAGQAVEDALVLENLFRYVRDPATVSRALSAYDQVRRPRKQRVAETSLEVGRMVASLDASISDDMDKIRESLETRIHWIWNRDLVAQNEEVVRLFKEAL